MRPDGRDDRTGWSEKVRNAMQASRGSGFCGEHSLLTCDETAELLRCSRRTVERRIAEGELEIVRNGRRVLVTGDSLERFLATNTYSASRGGTVRVLREATIGGRRLWQ
jgi:excisionase family DNA binding protein